MTTTLSVEISLSEVHKLMVNAFNDHNSIMKSAITLGLLTRLTKHAFIFDSEHIAILLNRLKSVVELSGISFIYLLSLPSDIL